MLHKLLRSLPDVNRSLRAGYLVGDTEYGGGGLSMCNKVRICLRYMYTSVSQSQTEMCVPGCLFPLILSGSIPSFRTYILVYGLLQDTWFIQYCKYMLYVACCMDISQAQARMVDRFRTGELNVLIATNIGNEGLDFKQCQVGGVCADVAAVCRPTGCAT